MVPSPRSAVLWGTLVGLHLGYVSGQRQCGVKPLSSSSSKQVYRIGVLAIRGIERAYEDFNRTADYLTAAIGADFDPPISFEIAPVAFGKDDAIDQFVSGEYDFVFANPTIGSCVDSEVGTNAIATMVARRRVNSNTFALTKFGGVIFARADNDEVNSIYDIIGKRTACISIAGLGSGQMQFRELQQAGIHHLQDPKQIIFMETQANIVRGVLDGKVDVGYVRTDQLERTLDLSGQPIDLSLIKIIDPIPMPTTSDGTPFPFTTSTRLYPEWSISALGHVIPEVTWKVQSSLLSMASHGAVAPALADCFESLSCREDSCYDQCFSFLDPSIFKSCSTDRDLAMLAEQAMSRGGNAGWRTSLSYQTLRNMQEETGFITRNENGFKCSRSSKLAEAIVCPENHFKKPDFEIANGCESAGLPCYGFQCLCSPCVPSFDVDFFPATGVEAGPNTVGCYKFSRCASIEHKELLVFNAVDNKKRNASFSATIHSGAELVKYSMRKIDDDERDLYELVVDTSDFVVGVYIVEIFIDGVPIPESPFRFEVLPRDCFALTGNTLSEPDTRGNCVCRQRSVNMRGGCIHVWSLLLEILVPLALVVAILVSLYARKKRKEADSVWKIDPKEVVFHNPPEILGRGAFGLVVLADYRGTKVAVKRANLQSKRPKENRGELAEDDDFSSGLGGDVSVDLSSENSRSKLVVNLAANLGSSSGFRNSLLWVFLKGRAKANVIDEIRKITKLRHPCITTVMGAMISPEAGPMMVLEYMPLGSLYDLLHNESMILETETIQPILGDIAKGLRFLHESSPTVVHGDLKAKNVLVDSQFRAKLADFGLAQIGRTVSRGAGGGTPYWMAPELLRNGSKNTLKSDIYSLGILLYEAYSRKVPYSDMRLNQAEILSQIVDNSILLRPPIPQNAPSEIAILMKACLHSEPSRRPSAQEASECIKVATLGTSESKTQSLLSQMFPAKVVEALRDGRKMEPTLHECVTVFFSDIVGYTQISSELPPTKVSDLLDRLYTKFDRLCSLHDVFKVETVGDAYMTVTNLSTEQADHVKIMAYFALDTIRAAATTLVDESNPGKGTVQIRVGFHSGPVASHVIGQSNPHYTIIGDTVNVASRMESNSKAGRIQCSFASATMLKTLDADLKIVRRGKIEVKGKGEMVTYWISPPSRLNASSATSISSCHDSKILDLEIMEEPMSLDKKTEMKRSQLVDWCTCVLEKYLGQIAALRSASTRLGRHQETNNASVPIRSNMVIDEVTAIVEWPEYDPKLIRAMKDDAPDADLSETVKGQLRMFVEVICSVYHSNKFHNFEHASHVLLSIDRLLTNVLSPVELENVDDQRKEQTVHQYTYGISSDPLTHFSVIFAALIHDVDHPGVSNVQLVKEGDALAVEYENRSVAEQNSIDVTWNILMSTEYDDLLRTIAATPVEMARFRQLVVNTVLATDIIDQDLKRLRNQRWEKAFHEALDDNSRDNTNRKATIVIEHLIQASDVAHTMQHWHIYRKWNELFFQECHDAYAVGRAEKDPSEGWYEDELGFFDQYIIPLTRKLKDCGVFGASSSEYLDKAMRNRAEWELRGREVVAEMVERVKANKRKRRFQRSSADLELSSMSLYRSLASMSLSGDVEHGHQPRRGVRQRPPGDMDQSASLRSLISYPSSSDFEPPIEVLLELDNF